MADIKIKEKANVVLVIEDDEDHAEMISRALEKNDPMIKITNVSSLNEAESYLRETIPDIVFVDFLLPDGNVVEFLEKHRDKMLFPMVIITAHGSEEIAIKTLKAGAIDYVVKTKDAFRAIPDISLRVIRKWNILVEKHLAEKALLKRQHEVNYLFEYAADALFYHDYHGKIIEVNKKACQSLGYSHCELLALSLFDIEKGYNSEKLQNIWKELPLCTTKIIKGMHQRKDGTTFPVELNLRILNDDDDRFVLAIARDITDRNKAEKNLLESENRYRTLTEMATDAIISINGKGDIVYWNSKAENMFGFYSSEVIGKPLTIIIPERFQEAHLKGVTNFNVLNESALIGKTTEVIGRKNEGDEFPIELSLAQYTSNNEIIFTAIIRDITNRKKIEDEIRHQASFPKLNMNPILEISPDKEIIYYNDAVLLFLDKFNKKNKSEIFIPDDFDDIFLTLKQKGYGQMYREVKIGDLLIGEYLHYVKEFDVIRIYTRDITEKKELELKLINEKKIVEKANCDLEKAYSDLKTSQLIILQQEKMACIGQLAAGVAHEINNPVGFISSNLETLKKYIERFLEFINTQQSAIKSTNVNDVIVEVDKKYKELKLDYILKDVSCLIEESLDGSSRIKKIVQDLKTFARPNVEKKEVSNINECIDSTLTIVWNELKYKVDVKKEYGNIPVIKCYPQQLSQVFMNILVNASQAIEKRGVIVIKTSQKGDYIFVSISDTGSGISKENLCKIFDPFFTTKDVGKGTGLGMSISYEIIKRHGGEITVESEVDKGSIFIVKIPVE